MNKKIVGRRGEMLAARYLENLGYQILARNVYTPHGEIDLVACLAEVGNSEGQPASTIVFVEVKTRRSTSFGFPEEAVNYRKQAHLVAAAEFYIQQHTEFTGNWRLDVIAIQYEGSSKLPQITHFENAIY